MTKKTLLALFSLLFIFISCSKNNDISNDFTVTVNDEINNFIYKGLNSYYLWQKDVPDLADNRFDNLQDLYSYFRKYDSPEKTFEGLRFQSGVTDRFSWIVNDYVALENSFQGLNLTTGMEYGLSYYKDDKSKVFGFVKYVIPNSSAASENVTRGMIFNTVNGTQLTPSNFKNLLFSKSNTFTIGLATYNAGKPTANGISKSLTKTEVQENPIAISKVIAVDSKKIGYLLYNQFASSYDQQLNAAFAMFKSSNI
ncbi:MAG: S41 family peptidase, partial [Polaribacter sp.]